MAINYIPLNFLIQIESRNTKLLIRFYQVHYPIYAHVLLLLNCF